jgi:hypothetical protein
VVRRNWVKRLPARGCTRDAARQGSAWHARHTIHRGDDANLAQSRIYDATSALRRHRLPRSNKSGPQQSLSPSCTRFLCPYRAVANSRFCLISSQLAHWTSTATGKSPAISNFGTEIISVVTTHGNDSRADRKVNVFERQRYVRSEVVIRSELTVSTHIVAAVPSGFW